MSGTLFYPYLVSGSPCSGSPQAVCSKTDARSITTTYTYDALNRQTGESNSANNPTATTYYYDQTSYNGLTIAYGKGRRTGMSDASGQTAWSFDTMGRTATERRTISGITKSLSYTYNLDGSLATVTYPSGRVITYTPGAAGRPLSAKDLANSINYAKNATYAPHGALAGALHGQGGLFSGITYSASFNNRLLPSAISATSTGGNALNLGFSYLSNGSVQTVTNNLNTNRTHNFTYDNLNRLATAQSQANSGQYCWGQSIPTDGTGYDPYANLLKINSTKCSSLTLNVSVNANNRVTNTGFTYDNAGNMLTDGVNTYTWEAHSRMQSAAGVTYTYDGDGRRVIKSNGTLYWYGADGAPVAETDASGNILNEYVFFRGRRVGRRDSSGSVYYYFADHLRTARISTTSSGSVCYDADFYPFGGEMPVTNTCPHHYKFTGDERDSETGLDHTHHRKYASNIGRWLTPDPASGGVGSAQTWNRYTYTLNSPTTLIDPSGLISQACLSNPACRIASNYGVGPLNPAGAYIPPNEFDQISFAPNSPCNDPWYAETHAECGPTSISIPIVTVGGGGRCLWNCTREWVKPKYTGICGYLCWPENQSFNPAQMLVGTRKLQQSCGHPITDCPYYLEVQTLQSVEPEYGTIQKCQQNPS